MGTLRYIEELIVLLIDEQGGGLLNVPDRTMGYALAGAVLMELAREGRIDTDPDSLVLVDDTPLGDDLLDPVLADIALEGGGQSIEYWVRHAARRHSDGLLERGLERLVERGILETDDGRGYFALSRLVFRLHRRYPTAGGTAQEEVRTRILRIVLDNEMPGPDDLSIISLAHACGLLQRILSPEEYEDAKERIEVLAHIGLVERTVGVVIRRITLAEAYEIRDEVLRRGGSWPKAPGLPIVGNLFSMNGDLPGFLVKQYRELGPVFEIGAFNRKFVVLAGAEANQFLTRRGNSCLRSWEMWADFNTALGTTHNIVSNDGHQHTRWRRTLQYGYSRGFIEGRLPEAIEVAKRQLDELPLNTPVTVNQACQLLVAEQIGILSAGTTPGRLAPYLKDISGYLKVMLLVHVVKRWPPVVQRLPRMRRYRQRMEDLYREVLASRSPGMRQGCPRDLVDDILGLHDEDPTFLPETNLFSTLVGPYMVGIDTAANALSFLLYALLKSPDALARAQSEADEFFAAGPPTAEGVRRMTDIHNALLETLRLYPVAPALLRHTANSFEFGGHYIPAGTSLMFALCVPHHLEEHYPDPLRFDIDRFAPGRQEHAAPGVFAPFGLGPHSCLGQGYAQTLLTANVATLLHHWEIALAPPDYQLKIDHNATSKPDGSFKFRMMRRRRHEG